MKWQEERVATSWFFFISLPGTVFWRCSGAAVLGLESKRPWLVLVAPSNVVLWSLSLSLPRNPMLTGIQLVRQFSSFWWCCFWGFCCGLRDNKVSLFRRGAHVASKFLIYFMGRLELHFMPAKGMIWARLD